MFIQAFTDWCKLYSKIIYETFGKPTHFCRVYRVQKKSCTNKSFSTRCLFVLIISFSWQLELNGQWAMVNNVECCIMNPNACHGSCKQCHQCNSSHLWSMFAYSYTQRKERVGLAIKAKITKVDTVRSDFQHKSRCHFFLSSQQRRQLVTIVRESTKHLASFDHTDMISFSPWGWTDLIFTTESPMKCYYPMKRQPDLVRSQISAKEHPVKTKRY